MDEPGGLGPDVNRPSIIDADGHVIESIPDFARFLDPGIRAVVFQPVRNREGVFPSLDGFHRFSAEFNAPKEGRERTTASDHRSGSGEDWLAFLEKTGIEHTVLFASEGLSVGFIQLADYAVRVCRAYNDYVAESYRKVSDRMHPMALIPMQDVNQAVLELRRAVKELGLVGAMIPSTGLPLHLGHEYFWPVYEEAANLGCALGIHGGSNRGIGIDTFTDYTASKILHHPVPLTIALVALVCHGVLDRYPDLRVGFMEGGCAWLVLLLDRMTREAHYHPGKAQRGLADYLQRGQVLIGCEGEDESLPYLAKRVGIEAFAYSSDYPHEVDLLDAQRQIQETMDNPDLSGEEKGAVLGGNARRFFRV